MTDTAARRFARAPENLLVLAAIAVHSVSLDRALSSLAAGVLVVAGLWRRTPVENTSGGLLLSGLAGGAAGLLLHASSPLPAGPVPPGVLSVVCGVLLALSVWCVWCGSQLYGWTYALLLATVSLHVQTSNALEAMLALLGVALLVAVFRHSRLSRGGTAARVAFLALGLAVLGGTFALARVVRATESALEEALYDLTRGASWLTGVGLDNSIALLPRARVDQSNRPLLEVDGAETLLRTNVFDEFDGARWTTSSRGEQARSLPAERPGASDQRTLMLLHALGDRWPVPAGTRRIEGEAATPRGGFVWTGTPPAGRDIPLLARRDDHLPPETPDKSLTALPDRHRPVFAELAREITGTESDPMQQARLIAHHLRTNFTYSLATDLHGAAHPLVILLKERRPAYCVYFASAMAVLLRSLDVPARVVGGFAAGERNRLTGRMVVRMRDAHAWVEAWDARAGRFVAFDPTPATTLDDAIRRSSGGWLESALDALASVLRRAWAGLRADPAAFLAHLASSPWVWVPLSVAMVRILLRRVRFGGRGRARTASVEAPRELRPALRRYREWLARQGIEPGPSESEDEVVERLRAARGDESASAATQFLAVYRRARFAGGDAAPVDRQAAQLPQVQRRGAWTGPAGEDPADRRP